MNATVSWKDLKETIDSINLKINIQPFKLENLRDLVLLKLLVSNFYSHSKNDFMPIANIYSIIGPDELYFHLDFISFLREFPVVISTNNNSSNLNRYMKANPEFETDIAGLDFFETENMYYIDSLVSLIRYFRWRIKVQYKELEAIENDNYQFHLFSEDLLRYWQGLSFQDSLNYLRYHIHKNNQSTIISEDSREFLKKLSSIYSTSEIFFLINHGIIKAYGRLNQHNNYRGNISSEWKNYVGENLEKLIKKYERNKSNQVRPRGFPKSILQDVFFNQVLKTRRETFILRPTIKNAQCIINNSTIIIH
jgi:hypothetical protein